MAISRLTIKGDDFYVGERVHVEARVFDEVAKIAASGLTPTLTFTRPDGTTTLVSEMTESETGLYRGSAVADIEGTWEITIAIAGEFIFRHQIYVSA